jgi:site-specific DNA-methyltransferase (adenine-specific)
MVAARLFSILVDLGVKLWITIDNKLSWEAPKGVVTKVLREELTTYKNDLLSIIRNSQKKYLDQHIDRIIHDDCLHALRQMPTNSVDLVCSDAPYGLGFMNKQWDQDVPSVERWQEVLRVLKPGGFAFVMSGPRQDKLTEMTSRLKQAGFEMGFTSIYWTYATGPTKARAISKLIQKRVAAARKSAGEGTGLPLDEQHINAQSTFEGSYRGFHLKPAVEVVLVAMKPITEKSVIDQVMANGKPVTQLDDCRIPYAEGESTPTRDYSKQRSYASGQVPGSKGNEFIGDARGRLPANILVSDNILDAGGDVLSGHSRYFSLDRWFETNVWQLPESVQATFPFLIVSKPSMVEKERGLEHIVPQPAKDGRKRKNTNPCVKPLKLMAFQITLASRPSDIVLDPFSGSGSTCIAAKMLGRRFIGIEREDEYCRIAEARLAAVPDLVQAKSVDSVDHCDTTNSGTETRVKKKSYGTYDWAGRTVNCCRGCTNNCRYCYARRDALRRHQIGNYDEWETCHIRLHDLKKKHYNYGELVMFPSTHDITPENLVACLTVLRKLLSAGNKVLIVSKPRLAVIRVLCAELGEFRENILFRLTITATDNAILSFWEPGAASYEERREALAYAKAAGYETSVSVEPMLDSENIGHLIEDLQPLVTETIWIGTMNHLKQIRVDSPEVELELARIRGGQTDERLKAIYNSHHENPVIRWKKEIRKVVGIEPPEEPAPTSAGEVQNVN